jgi:hypothetical protein
MTIASKDFSDLRNLEKYSSAFTLSDMEIFIFPELYYPLVLANIMSPIIWSWRDDPWFKDIEKKSFTQKTNRIKQFIIQNYVFNLDLATWGLTTKTKELERFRNFFDLDLLRQSNALFGYEGDKYYFDIDIRKHFGLDKYDSDVIPYWKTETVEAMTAFRFKDNFNTGAGECVSLSALYAAAMFIVGRISLDKIFMIATPLHSQNFIVEKDGLLTNNRRIVTKNMWFNGTSLSARARRALEKEKITIVSHISGYVHTLYKEATINKKAYELFSEKLREFLRTDLDSQKFINFLRFKSKYKSSFQYKCSLSGKQRYILLEKLFEYEHSSKFNFSPETREQLVNEIDGDDFHLSPIQDKILLNDLENVLANGHGKNLEEMEKAFAQYAGQEHSEMIGKMFIEISSFLNTDPRLPSGDKSYLHTKSPLIRTTDSRKEIMESIINSAGSSEVSDLALYIYRQMDMIDWLPFVKASVERNPVCFSDLNGTEIKELYEILAAMPDESIYDRERLALPDEVWNFKRGDGIEKAMLMADYIINNDKNGSVIIEIDNSNVTLRYCGEVYQYTSGKRFKKSIYLKDRNYRIDNL